MNRQNRRHPVNPFLQHQEYSSKKRIPDIEVPKPCSTSKGRTTSSKRRSN